MLHVRLGVARDLQARKESRYDVALVLVHELSHTANTSDGGGGDELTSLETYPSMDLKPSDRAGASAEAEVEPEDVAELGIGKDGGVKTSPTTAERV
jgi:hypothetical protein